MGFDETKEDDTEELIYSHAEPLSKEDLLLLDQQQAEEEEKAEEKEPEADLT